MVFNSSLDEVGEVVGYLKNIIDEKNCIVLMQGDLASGKTTFIQHFVKYCGINSTVTSPTFAIQNIYDDKIYHYDIYNKSIDEFMGLGLLEEFDKDGVHFVEWGGDDFRDILLQYGFRIIIVKIAKLKNKREYNITNG